MRIYIYGVLCIIQLRSGLSCGFWGTHMTRSFSLIATIPPEFDETYRNNLVSAVLNDQIEDRAISAPSSDGSSVGLKGNHIKSGVPLIACDSIRLSPTPSISFKNNLVKLVAVFCPSSLVASAREQTNQQIRSYDDDATEKQPQRPIVEWFDEETKLSNILLSMIHPFLAQNFVIRAILTNQTIDRHPSRFNKPNAPGDIVILNLSYCPYETIVEELFEATNCELIRAGSEAILKLLLLSKIELGVSLSLAGNSSTSKPAAASSNDTRKLHASKVDIPSCAVCLFRIDPSRLGLPRPPSHQICSKFCSSSSGRNCNVSCPRQRLLLPWPPPNHCETCHIIQNYWKKYSDDTTIYNERDEVFCNLCGMQETLWVCLTCAFVGCGRYSNKHAAEHNDATHHPFCLELSTLRIWSYVDSEYIHRVDLLECPASLQNLHQLPSIVRGSFMSTPERPFSSTIALSHSSTPQARVSHDSHDSHSNNRFLDSLSAPSDFDFPSRMEANHYERMVASSFASVDEKTPKKATMIGEEYEVLLQSALEDQAQYYEGEIAWLRATLSGSFDFISMECFTISLSVTNNITLLLLI